MCCKQMMLLASTPVALLSMSWEYHHSKKACDWQLPDQKCYLQTESSVHQIQHIEIEDDHQSPSLHRQAFPQKYQIKLPLHRLALCRCSVTITPHCQHPIPILSSLALSANC